jgi:hypothetical protein
MPDAAPVMKIALRSVILPFQAQSPLTILSAETRLMQVPFAQWGVVQRLFLIRYCQIICDRNWSGSSNHDQF